MGHDSAQIGAQTGRLPKCPQAASSLHGQWGVQMLRSMLYAAHTFAIRQDPVPDITSEPFAPISVLNACSFRKRTLNFTRAKLLLTML